ncbi:MAG: Cys-tRNA(Pro) deacylase [Lachnospiraceae bacterium]|jgi:Cys-tRNA(Pro)/Cys-tRNA(Cys) deacylase|nr:Cys-tRNA(Pro) deacylase [Lachnospiraceae bacterium]
MAKKADNKTNAMRILETEGIPFKHMSYETDGEFSDGVTSADVLGLPHEQVFKTLVTLGSDGQHYVFVIPVEEELDFKKCARSVGVKSVQMIHVKELFGLTGYVRGGCTAIGMKKPFVTRLDESAQLFDEIYVSGGRIGLHLCLNPDDFLKAAYRAEYADLTQ